MRIEIEPGIRLFVDIEGASLVPDGPHMREKPTLLLFHAFSVAGHGVDHDREAEFMALIRRFIHDAHAGTSGHACLDGSVARPGRCD